MAEQDSGRPPAEAFHTVTEPRQAQLLTHADDLKYIDLFIAKEMTVKAAAEEMGCELDTMLYRVRKLVAAGLLEVTRVEKRAGRPIKHYRSVHNAYFIPFEVTPFADVEERLTEALSGRRKTLARALAKLLQDFGWLGVRVYRDASGEIWHDTAPSIATDFKPRDPAFPAVIQTSMDVHLTHEEAKALQLELFALTERHQLERGQREHGQHYLFEVALVPLEP
jgi:predicted transcriptional regulator